MNAETLATTPPTTDAAKLAPNAKELRALRIFASRDETRPHMTAVYAYESEGGLSYVATDGHTIVVRRSGTHRALALDAIQAMAPFTVNGAGELATTNMVPPRWASVVKPGRVGKLAPAYGVNPDYFARIGDVERAAGARASEDYVPRPALSKKDAAKERSYLKEGSFAKLTIPSDPLDGWHWTLETKEASWQGVIMPRRV